MPVRTEADAAVGPPGALARPDWEVGGAFAADELRLEQSYRRQRLRRHLRLVHGWGVVCGLNVVAANDGWDLIVCPGYGISPCGDEILVQRQFRFDLRDYLWTRPIGAAADHAWIGIEACEHPAAYQPVERSGCGCECECEQPRVAVSRLVDGFRMVVWWTAPVLPWGGFDACSGAAPTCPRCPDTCGLPLGSVALPP